MLRQRLNDKEKYFKQDADIGIIGRGISFESCFVDIAQNMFSLVTNLSAIHATEVIRFKFQEADVEIALITWLNLLLEKARTHELIFTDFRLKHENDTWEATVAGGVKINHFPQQVEIKCATFRLISIHKIDHIWVARCTLEI